MNATHILCVGEVLWDALPAGLFLGGAPFNVACHLHQLGHDVVFASRAGDDELGREIARRVRRQGLSTRWLQTDPELETGYVIVTLDETGSPSFEIVHPSAWDNLAPDDELLDAARRARAVVFGSLAQRSPGARVTIRALRAAAPCRVFDINLRPPFVDRTVIEENLADCDLLKLNDQELETLAQWFGLPPGLEAGARALADAFPCRTVCVTCGAAGAALLHAGRWYSHPGYAVQVTDAVGSGDAFLAALLSGILSDRDPNRVLADANALGAFVATRSGATPPHDRRHIDAIAGSGGTAQR